MRSMIGFEILVNGKRVCIAGNEGGGWTTVSVSRYSGLTQHKLALDATGHDQGVRGLFGWDTPAITVGDEITIKVIETDRPDPSPRPKTEWTPPPDPPGGAS